MPEEIKITVKTKEKYDLFVECYLESFNATQSAIRAGYSKKTAGQQGHRLLKNVYIRKKIKEEMGKLRDRMRDEGLRSFSMLLGIALDTEEKLQKHNIAEEKLEKISGEIGRLELEVTRISKSISRARRKADAMDGRENRYKEPKKAVLSEIDSMNDDIFELEIEIQKLLQLKKQHSLYYLNPREWERYQSLKKSVFQDILDRGGFKALDKIEHSGSIQTPRVNPQISSLNKEDLEALVSLGHSIAENSG